MPELGTSWEMGVNPGQPQAMSPDDYIIDLDDRAGLTPGLPIRITVSSPDSFLWLGGFHIDGGLTTISSDVNLSHLLGGETSAVSATLFSRF